MILRTLGNLIIISILCNIISPFQAIAAVHFEWNCNESAKKSDCRGAENVTSIYIYDEIDFSTASQIGYLDGRLPSDKPFPKVYINSLGGDPDSAKWIGRILRRRNAEIYGRDFLFPDRMPRCSSACVIIAAGATKRNMLHVGFHPTSVYRRIRGEQYEMLPFDPAESMPSIRYMEEMGISPDIKEIILKTAPESITSIEYDLSKEFSQQEIVRLGFRMSPVTDDEIKILKTASDKKSSSFDTLRKLADEGNSESSRKIAHQFLHGIGGFDKNVQEASKWFEKAGEQGDLYSYHELGVIYFNGWGNVPVDHQKAAKYYRIAARKGFGASQNNLGWMLYMGDGVQKNIYEAIYWVSRAIEQGDPFSYGSMGSIMFETDVFEKDDAEIYKWLKLAVDGLPKGSAKAQNTERLKLLVARMTPEQIAEGEKRAKEWKPLKPSSTRMRDKDDF